MLYAVMPKEDYKQACDVLREYTGESEAIKSGQLEENIDKVYESGVESGKEIGYSDGYSEGHTQGVKDGLDKTKDATCTEKTALEGETFYAGGIKKTGNIKKAIGGISAVASPTLGYIDSDECVALNYTPSEPIYLNPNQGSVTLKAKLASFGNAEAQQVEKGAVFTSAAGFQKIGTSTAYDDGYNSGYDDGYTEGEASVSSGSIDWISIWDKMLGDYYTEVGGYVYNEETGEETSWATTSVLLQEERGRTVIIPQGMRGEDLYNGNEFTLVVIPRSIKNIVDYAFECAYGDYCDVVCLAKEPPTLGWQGMWSYDGGGCPPRAIYVPDESVEDYMNATSWAEFTDLILPLSEFEGG